MARLNIATRREPEDEQSANEAQLNHEASKLHLMERINAAGKKGNLVEDRTTSEVLDDHEDATIKLHLAHLEAHERAAKEHNDTLIEMTEAHNADMEEMVNTLEQTTKGMQEKQEREKEDLAAKLQKVTTQAENRQEELLEHIQYLRGQIDEKVQIRAEDRVQVNKNSMHFEQAKEDVPEETPNSSISPGKSLHPFQKAASFLSKNTDLSTVEDKNSSAEKSYLPPGWKAVESRSRPGVMVYENQYTFSRISVKPTTPAKKPIEEDSNTNWMNPLNKTMKKKSEEGHQAIIHRLPNQRHKWK